MTAPRSGSVSLVGAGPGDPGLLTLKAARAISFADVVVYDYLASAPIVALAPHGCERISVGKRPGEHSHSQDEISALLVRLAREGKRVVRLKGGDPFVFGRGAEEAAVLREAGVPFEVVPGITSALAAPAYAGIPTTHRETNAAFTVVTGREDPAKIMSSLDFAKLANPHQTLIFLMAIGKLRLIAARLLEAGMPADIPVAVVREGTKPQQETLVATLATVADEVERQRFSAPAVVVIGEVVRERQRLRWFDATPLFGKRVLVTRPARSDEFAAALWQMGAEPVIAPVTAIVPPDDEGAAAEAVGRVRDYAWAVFSSPNGVEAFFTLLARRDADARFFGDARVAAIGPKTAECLQTHGIRVDFVPPAYVAETLAAGLLERTDPGDRLLVFRAQEARDVLPDTLRTHWRDVDVVAGYKSIALDDPRIAEMAEATDVWTFTSAGIVRAFLANVPGAEAMAGERIVACIGPVTAQAARDGGLDVDVVAQEYTPEGLLQALQSSATFSSPKPVP